MFLAVDSKHAATVVVRIQYKERIAVAGEIHGRDVVESHCLMLDVEHSTAPEFIDEPETIRLHRCERPALGSDRSPQRGLRGAGVVLAGEVIFSGNVRGTGGTNTGMTDIYDASGMEPSLVATLAALRVAGPAPTPNDSMTSAAKRVAPPLAAFAHTLGTYLPGPNFADFELDAELADNDLDDWAHDLKGAGCDLKQCLLIGTTGGGEEYLFMAAQDNEAGYVLLLWAMDGEPYEASDAPVWRVGLFSELFGFLVDRGRAELDERLRAIV